MTNFLEKQGYKMSKNILMQDNKSAMKLEENGRNSCTGNSRHIDIRYFFVKDRVNKNEIKIEYCPTEIMLADFFTKPLQGSLFKFFRDIIMGYKSIEAVLPDTYKITLSPKIKECVENGEKNNKTIYREKMIYGNKDEDKEVHVRCNKIIPSNANIHVESKKLTSDNNTPVYKPTYAETTARKVRKKLEN